MSLPEIREPSFNDCYLPGVGRFRGPPTAEQYERAEAFIWITGNWEGYNGPFDRIARTRAMLQWTPAALREMRDKARLTEKAWPA